MEENENKISLLDLLSANTQVRRKIVAIDSSYYTDEAFEYLLKLVDENDGIAFVVNRKQIYSHGTWFGSDVWADTLKAFSGFDITNVDSSITHIEADDINTKLGIQGDNAIELSVEQEILSGKNTLHIDYNLNKAIDKENYVEVDNENSLALGVEDNKLVIKKHSYDNVHLSEPSPLEYDIPDSHITVSVYIDDIEKFEFIRVFSDNAFTIEYEPISKTINAFIPSNVDTEIGIEYFYDGVKCKTSVTQKWGYGWYHGFREINALTFDTYSKGIDTEFVEKDVTINQPLGEYAFFAYPKQYNIVFIDTDTSIAGGWKKFGTFTKYSKNIEYQIYRTSNAGLGTVIWHITKKQN